MFRSGEIRGDEWLNELEQARKSCGLSIREAADLCQIPYRTFQNWELGLRSPPAYIKEYIKKTLVNETRVVSVTISKDAILIDVSSNGCGRGQEIYRISGEERKIPLSALEWIVELAQKGYRVKVYRI